jgi:hypothetical protein
MGINGEQAKMDMTTIKRFTGDHTFPVQLPPVTHRGGQGGVHVLSIPALDSADCRNALASTVHGITI